LSCPERRRPRRLPPRFPDPAPPPRPPAAAAQETVAPFLDKWVQSHIGAASKRLKRAKPVLFEEFGKKLDASQQTADGIRQASGDSRRAVAWRGVVLRGLDSVAAGRPAAALLCARVPRAPPATALTRPSPTPHRKTPQLRDPIYSSTYDSVERAIQGGQPIAGSLFWKWAIPVFDKQDPRGAARLRFGACDRGPGLGLGRCGGDGLVSGGRRCGGGRP
jgi:hypothetical protein